MSDFEMVQYLRGNGNHPIGVMIALFDKQSNTVRIGWSKCNKKDQFERERGLMIARARTLAGSELPIPSSPTFLTGEHEMIEDANNLGNFIEVPVKRVIPCLQDQYITFIERVVTYFKSVDVNKFIVCGPSYMAITYANAIVDTRNLDRERHKK